MEIIVNKLIASFRGAKEKKHYSIACTPFHKGGFLSDCGKKTPASKAAR